MITHGHSMLIVGLSSLVAILVSRAAGRAADATIAEKSPSSSGSVDMSCFAKAEAAIDEAIQSHHTPGAVLVAGTGDAIVYEKAFGQFTYDEQSPKVTTRTVYDLASLSKNVGCLSCLMVLWDRGRIDVHDPVSKYLPEFAANGKEKITIEQLLVHQSGLVPDNPMSDYKDGPEEAWRRIMASKPVYEPGQDFKYSDVNFLVLGKLVEKVSGKALDQFAHDEVFEPLGMKDTTYRPPASMRERIAPTEKAENLPKDSPIVLVHDPRSRALGGVAGHAGVFSTGDDVAKWVQMLINGGVGANGTRILKESTVRAMLTEHTLPNGRQGRGLGVDINSGYAPAARGGRFEPHKSFGHTGYTGTSYWADPVHKCFYVLLTNRVYPDDKADVKELRRKVSTACAEAFLGPAPATQAASDEHMTPIAASAAGADIGPVFLGIDMLERQNFSALKGKRVGLITNHTGRDKQGQRTIDLLFNAPDVKLVALFSPEHGIEGKLDEKVGDVIEPKTGLKVHSLYGKTNKPTPEMLQGVDALIFDIQDIGARFYTYSATLGLCMRAAGESQIGFVVLDRPNPITGEIVEGPIADKSHFGFTAFGPLPVAHGMTFGELARLYNGEPAFNVHCDLSVVECEGWTRKMWWDETRLPWINPSPNMRSLNAALLYPGVCLLEATNVSVGRGTDTPFEHFGAPWIDADRYAQALNNSHLPGLKFEPTSFTPDSSKFKGEQCHGVHITVTDRDKVEPVRCGIYVAWHLYKLFPQQFEVDKVERLLQNTAATKALKTADDPVKVIEGWQRGLNDFKRVREKYLIYK